MAIDLYMMEGSQPCRAVMLTAKYLGININKKLIDVLKGEQMDPEFVKINPRHCIPTINDNGFILWESRAIMAYLVNQYAPDSDLYPEDPKKRAIIDRAFYFDIGTLGKSVREAMYGYVIFGKDRDPEKEAILKATIQTYEDILENSPYIAGDKLSLADISLISNLSIAKHLAKVMEFDFSQFCNLHAWSIRVKGQLPCYKEITEPGDIQWRDYLATKKR